MVVSSSSSLPVRSGLVKGLLLATAFIAMLNETSVNVALSGLMQVFGVEVSTIQWLVTGFMLVMTVVVPTTAYLIVRFPTRGLYFVSLALLIAGSVLAGLAPAFGWLLAGRLIQAVGTCIFMSLAVTTVLRLTPPQKRGQAMGLIGLVTLFGPAIAPPLGGLLFQTLGPSGLFLAPLPLFLALGIWAWVALPNLGVPERRSLDGLSVVLSVLAFGSLLWAVSNLPLGARQPWLLGAAFVAGFGFLGWFIARQGRGPGALLDLGVFRHKNFALGMVAVFFSILTVFGLTLLTPLLLTQVTGLLPALAGLAMLPGGLINGLLAPVVGGLYDRHGPRALVIGGSVLVLLAVAGYALLPAGAPVFLVMALHMAALVAMALVMTVSQANSMNALSGPEIPHGTAIMSTLMQLGGGVGSAVYSAWLAAGTGADPMSGFRLAFAGGALLLLVPLAAALAVRRQ